MIEFALRCTHENYKNTNFEHYIEWHDYSNLKSDFNINEANFDLWVYKVNNEIYYDNNNDFKQALVMEILNA